MTSRLLAGASVFCAAVLLAGCAAKEEPVAEAAPPAPPPDLTRSDCYTVVLFDGFEIKDAPEGTLPEHAAFLGEWRFGAWDGKWCHDLLVTEILADGSVLMMDKHAPYEPWGQPATAFPRKGRIDKNGVLRFRHGTTQRAYQFDAATGRLKGLREDVNGSLVAELRRAGPPVPPKRDETEPATAAAPATAETAAAAQPTATAVSIAATTDAEG
ncbi:MAG: hypothetical protein AAF899_17975 [Pseudomonadota bacterium]